MRIFRIGVLLLLAAGIAGLAPRAARAQAPLTLHIPAQQRGGTAASMPSLLDKQLYIATDAGLNALWYGNSGTNTLLAFPLTVQLSGTPLAQERSINFTGAGVTAADDAANHRTTVTISGSGSGTVTSFSAGNLSPLFTSSVATATTTPSLSFTAVNQSANLVYAGPSSGAAAAPTFRFLVPVDYPVFIASGVSHAAGAVPDPGATAGTARFLREDATWAVPAGGSFTAGGDLSGTSSSQTVTGIQSKAVPALASGYLHYNGTAWVFDTPTGTVPAGTSGQTLYYNATPSLTAASNLKNDGTDITLSAGTKLNYPSATTGFYIVNPGGTLSFGSGSSTQDGFGIGLTTPTDKAWTYTFRGISGNANSHFNVTPDAFFTDLTVSNTFTAPGQTPIRGETPSGTINGVNTAFTLAHTPSAAGVSVYLGATATTLYRIAPSAYTLSGTTLTMGAAPATGNVLLVDYEY